MVGKSKRNSRRNTRRNTRRNSKRNTRRNRNTRDNLRRNTSRNRNTRRNNRKNNRKNRNNRRNKNGGMLAKMKEEYVLIDRENTLDRNHLYVGVSAKIEDGGMILEVEEKCPDGFEERALSDFEGFNLYKSSKRKDQEENYQRMQYRNKKNRRTQKFGPAWGSVLVTDQKKLEDFNFNELMKLDELRIQYKAVRDGLQARGLYINKGENRPIKNGEVIVVIGSDEGLLKGFFLNDENYSGLYEFVTEGLSLITPAPENFVKVDDATLTIGCKDGCP